MYLKFPIGSVTLVKLLNIVPRIYDGQHGRTHNLEVEAWNVDNQGKYIPIVSTDEHPVQWGLNDERYAMLQTRSVEINGGYKIEKIEGGQSGYINIYKKEGLTTNTAGDQIANWVPFYKSTSTAAKPASATPQNSVPFGQPTPQRPKVDAGILLAACRDIAVKELRAAEAELNANIDPDGGKAVLFDHEDFRNLLVSVWIKAASVYDVSFLDEQMPANDTSPDSAPQGVPDDQTPPQSVPMSQAGLSGPPPQGEPVSESTAKGENDLPF